MYETLAVVQEHWLSIPMMMSVGYIALEVVGFILAADAIMHGRTPQGTVAWVGALIAFPLLTVPVYLLFGSRRIAGYVRARRRGVGKLTELARKVESVLRPYSIAAPGVLSADRTEVLGFLPVTRGNRHRLLIDGQATFDAMFAAIDSATRSLAVQFYIIRDDALGREFKRRLLAAKARGVKTFLLYDSIGSQGLPRSYVNELRAGGVDVQDFRPSKAPRFRIQLNFRNHRKVIVADGEVAFVGGLNVGDEYMGRDKHIGPWRDTQMEIRGPSALAVQLAFVEDWFCCTQQIPDLCWTPVEAANPGDKTAIIPSGPADEMETAQILFLQLIQSAKQFVWIATPYFVADETLISALQAAALRGVDVRLLIPRRSDSRLVDLAARAAVEELLAAEIAVHEHGKRGTGGGFMHQKVLLTEKIVCVGSANMDNRSIRINFEIAAVADDAALAQAAKQMLENDFKGTPRLTRVDLRTRRWTTRLIYRLARLFSPIL